MGSQKAASANPIRDLANLRYKDEQWQPLHLRPDALSTTRHDDVARLIRNERGRVLDLACGSGQLVIALADQFDALVGVDVSDARIELGRRILRARFPALASKVTLDTVEGDGRLPFENGSFDAVIACTILEVVPDVFCMMDELARVCRPGGALIVSVANICYFKHVVDLLRGRIPVTWSPTRDMAQWRLRGWDDGCLRYFSKRTLADLLEHVGFVPEAWAGCGGFAKLRRWYLNLCGGITVRARRR